MSRRNPIVSTITAIAALCTAGALSACSSSGGAANPASTTPTSSQPPTVATSTAATTPTTSAAPTTSAQTSTATSGGTALPACRESQLRANAVLNPIAGLNRHVVKLTFVNTSKTTCTLTGYPGAAIEDSSGRQVKQAERVVGGPVGGTIEEQPQTIPLKPGASAFAWLEGQSTREPGAAQAGCDAPKYPRILVTPPNTRTAVPFTIGWPLCSAFDVHPVREQ